MIFQGILFTLFGVALIAFRPQIKNWTGDISFAERYLGPGGTWTFFVILGVFFFFFGIAWATGSFGSFADRVFGGLY